MMFNITQQMANDLIFRDFVMSICSFSISMVIFAVLYLYRTAPKSNFRTLCLLVLAVIFLDVRWVSITIAPQLYIYEYINDQQKLI